MLLKIFAEENISTIVIFGSIMLIATFVVASKVCKGIVEDMLSIRKIDAWIRVVLLFIYLLIEALLIIVVFYLISLISFP